MAPKLPKQSAPEARAAAALAFIRSTGVAHTLRDLEKAVPAGAAAFGAPVASIQVKDVIQVLLDDSDAALSVDRCGAGNWYWSFPSAVRAARAATAAAARADRDRCAEAVARLERVLDELTAPAEQGAGEVVGEEENQKEGAELEEEGGEKPGEEVVRALRAEVAAVQEAVAAARERLRQHRATAGRAQSNSQSKTGGCARWSGAGAGCGPAAMPAGAAGKRAAIEAAREEAGRATGQIEDMFSWVRETSTADRAAVTAWLRDGLVGPDGTVEWDEEAGGLKEIGV